MNPANLPEKLRPYLIPQPTGHVVYRCLGCRHTFDISSLLYTCPRCGQVLMLEDLERQRLRRLSGDTWRQIFDYRKLLALPALQGIYRFHEFTGPILPLEAVVYLGEGHTPLIEANAHLQRTVGLRFFFKNEGQNPSASFKDRGMASALSYINFLLQQGLVSEVLAVCASTGDTSAAAALYASFLQPQVKSVVLLPHKRITPQQLSQPLGSGAKVFEIPGVFDDCMKVVEAMSERYEVALLNSKNAWRILGQESYSYEIAQDCEYALSDKVVVVPIGNAGNITAILNGFLKFHETGIIDALPKVLGVQSEHANPVYRYYQQADPAQRAFAPVSVKPSVAQAAMIGNPVSMPRVIRLVDHYNQVAGGQRVFFVEVTEQAIMDWQLAANRNGHIACTHGGEALAGLKAARDRGYISDQETAVLDATAHALKFAGFQEMYFQNNFPADFGVTPRQDLINQPIAIRPGGLDRLPAPGAPLQKEDFERFVAAVSQEIAARVGLQKRRGN